jgi:beta-N-acetylhexosaminidase
MALKDSFRTVARFFAGAGGRRRMALAVLVSVAGASAVGGAIVGGGGDGSERGGDATPGAQGDGPAPGIPSAVTKLAGGLTIERKVAQLMLVGFPGRDPRIAVVRRLRRLDLGGIVLDRANYAGPEPLRRLAREAVAAARRRRGVRPWVMAPQQGGEFNAFPGLPPADAPGGLESPRQAGAQARQAAISLRSLGVTGVLGPDVDVGLEHDPLGALAYSDEPGEVADFASASVGAYSARRMFSAVQHFPGLGAASQSTEVGPAQVGLSTGELTRRDLVPFAAAFRRGAPAVVLSNALYPMDNFTVPGSLSSSVATDLLRGRFHFRGVAITDDLADPAITAISTIPAAAVEAVVAGADMVYISGAPRDQDAAHAALLRAARRGKISRERLEEAVQRVLAAKLRFGLLR